MHYIYIYRNTVILHTVNTSSTSTIVSLIEVTSKSCARSQSTNMSHRTFLPVICTSTFGPVSCLYIPPFLRFYTSHVEVC